MRNMTISALSLMFIAATTTAHAATEVPSSAGHQSIRVISVSGANNLDDAMHQLSIKADAAGAPYFKVISAGGKNKIIASAELLK